MPAQMQRQMGVIPEGYQKDFFIKKTRQKFCRRTDQNRGGEQQKRLGPRTLRQQEQTQRAQPIDRADGQEEPARGYDPATGEIFETAPAENKVINLREAK